MHETNPPSRGHHGPCEITTDDGTQLTAPNDLLLAWSWAEHAHGAEWATLSYGQQCTEVSAALTALRDAVAAAGST